MKEQLPSPSFDANRYERPQQNWICGYAAEGKPCRIGPDRKGRCRATFECQPFLELKPGETKGRYRCTRSAQFGGPCDLGPLPNGVCSCPISKCNPVRSLRGKRGVLTLCVVALSVAVLAIVLSRPIRAKFVSPGPLSAQHGTSAFAALANTNSIDGNSCGACHEKERAGIFGWVKSAMEADPGPFDFRALASTEAPSMTRVDTKCMRCHTGHMFHQPNVVSAHSCSDCHREHRGPGPMNNPSDANCLSCHANPGTMEASFAFGKTLSAAAFDYRPDRGRVLFKTARPAQGYTELIHSFSTDHPEFQVLAEKLKDPNSLRFNHQLHLTGLTVAEGRKMSCADCHKPDAAGIYYLKITYDQNCKNCHQLKFDLENPELTLPHGNEAHVRDFLRSLPAQYADFGANQKKITARRDLEVFVQNQMRRIRQETGSGEELEQRVFFSNARTAPVSRIGQREGTGSARFSGCAYCHTVTASEHEVPQVVKPIIPDRWLIRARFNHGKHFKLACNICHDAEHSRDTADILLPAKQTCTTCHSPSGGVVNSCSTCHDYHSPGHVKGLVEAKR